MRKKKVITEQVNARRALQEREEPFRQVFEYAGTGIAIANSKGQLLQCNPAFCRMVGYSNQELLHVEFQTLIHPDDRESNQEKFQRLKDAQLPFFEIENRYVRKDGQIVWAKKIVSILRDEMGNPTRVLRLFTDVTEHRRTEQALVAGEHRMRAILNTASDAIITIDVRGIIQTVNPATERMFGYTQDELVGQNVKLLMPPPYRDEHDEYIARYRKSRQARIIGIGREVTAQRKGGTTFPIRLAVSEIDHLGLFTGMIQDISERNKLQRDILRIAEDEQRRIGQDLHDGTQQELVGLGMLAQTLLDKLEKESRDRPSANSEDAYQLAKKILDGISRTQREVRNLSHGLVPSALGDEGLMDALRTLAHRTDGLDGVTCAFKCEQPVEIADRLTATHLYRIAQEAVNNALKHGPPEHILIALEADQGWIVLRVADDGRGFDATSEYEGMGLKTMRYRASLIGGNLTITPIDTGGILVTCYVLEEAKNK